MSWFSKIWKPLSFFDTVRAGKAKDVRKHLQSGTDPNEKDDGGSAYPLHFAVHAGVAIVRLLIEYGANVNVKTDSSRNGKTPLHIAAGEGYVDVVRLLLQSGADVNATDDYGHTPLFSAAAEVGLYENLVATFGTVPSDVFDKVTEERSGRQEVVRLLKLSGAVPSSQDVETAKAMGSIPEAVRQNKHMALAYKLADFDYHGAVRQMTMEYPFLWDAYAILRKKRGLSTSEKVFVERFERYEKML